MRIRSSSNLKPPFEIIKESGGTLEWGFHPDGRFWVRPVCKVCGSVGALAVGLAGAGRFSRSKAVSETIGYTQIRYRRSHPDSRRKQGWYPGTTRITTIIDLCSKCSHTFIDKVSSYCRHYSLNYGDIDFTTASSLYLKWLDHTWTKMLEGKL